MALTVYWGRQNELDDYTHLVGDAKFERDIVSGEYLKKRFY